MSSSASAWQTHVKRLGMFEVSPEADVAAKYSGVISRARITATEYSLLEGLVESKTDIASSKAKINKTIGLMDLVKIASTELNATIWGFAQTVIRGKALEF